MAGKKISDKPEKMKKEEILREDGRYLIYYWFDEEPDDES